MIQPGIKPNRTRSRGKTANKRPSAAASFKIQYLVPEGKIKDALSNIRSAMGRRISPFPNSAWFVSCAILIVITIQLLTLGLNADSDKKQILGVATSAYSDLNSASENLTGRDFQNALDLFDSAQSNLKSASEKLSEYKAVSWAVPAAKKADNILKGGYLLADAGKGLAASMRDLEKLRVDSTGSEENIDLPAVFRQNRQILNDSLGKLEAAHALFSDSDGLPSEHAAAVQKGRNQIESLIGIIKELISLEDLYLALLGEEPKTMLLVFQNYDELRATGGFIGTYGAVRFSSGRIERMKIESIYNLDGSLLSKTAAPGPFQPEIPKWGMRDSNWFVDFPISARKLLRFYEIGKETADGVIALTPKLFVDLLRITGPIEMPSYGVTLSADNFQDVVQDKTSHSYDKALNQPKKFLADFAPILIDRINGTDSRQKLSLFQAITGALKEKHVLIYSKDEQEQSVINRLGYSGEIKETDHDYLAIFNSNMGGTKTDLSIKQAVNLKSRILSDGSVLNKLEIVRQNEGKDWNSDYLRVLVPKGSVLVSSEGFDEKGFNRSSAEGYETDPDLEKLDRGIVRGNVLVTEEAGKTEFAGWIDTAPLAGKTVKISYVLPVSVKPKTLSGSAPYSLLYQKQPGIIRSSFEASIDFGDYAAEWSSTGQTGGSSRVESVSDTDRLWSFILKHD